MAVIAAVMAIHFFILPQLLLKRFGRFILVPSSWAGQIGSIVLQRHCCPEVAQHLYYLFCIYSILQRENDAGVTKVYKSDVIQPGFPDDFIMQSAYHLR